MSSTRLIRFIRVIRGSFFWALLFICAGAPLGGQEPKATNVPRWDARGLGQLPRMGITSLDVSDDGKEIVVGTIAAFGDPNVIVLDQAGKVARHYRVGQQWIDNVAFLPGSQEVIAICTMPAGRAGDRVEAFLLKGDQTIPHRIKQEGPWFFHYGDHSNHPTMKLARRSGNVSDGRSATALLAGDQIVIYRKDREPAIFRLPVSDPDASVSLAVDDSGWAVVGVTSRDREGAHNLYLIDPDKKKPVWSRPVNKNVEAAPPLEKGLYGTPTLPDGKREELPQRDEKIWAPLSVAIHGEPSPVRGRSKKLIAVADYQGWQRWVRSSATGKEDNQGLRFVATKPTIAVYDQAGKIVRKFGYGEFMAPFWCALRFSPVWKGVHAWPHHWKCRGLGGQAILPTDVHANTRYSLSIADGEVGDWTLPCPLLDFTLGDRRGVIECPWDGRLFGGEWDESPQIGGPALVRFLPGKREFLAARTDGKVFRFGSSGNKLWQTDLNKVVPKAAKPWVANARAERIVPGVWQIPGGRVESDLGGQRLVEAPDGYILIEGHAGLSFEREWAAMEAVGLDPRKVKYVLPTHEHGDHAPGAYLWRVVTGAKFVCSEEMAYTCQQRFESVTKARLGPGHGARAGSRSWRGS